MQHVELNYAQLYQEARKLAASFVHLNLKKGDRIGIFSPNNYEWALTQYAAAMADLILVNVNPAYQTIDLEYALNKVQCSAVILRKSFKHSNYVNMFKELGGV